VIKRIWFGGAQRIWTSHRALAIAIPAIVVVTFLVASLLLMSASGGTSQASATPGATPSGMPGDTPSAWPSDSPFSSPSSSATATLSPSPSISTSPTPTPIPAGWIASTLDGVYAPADLAHREPVAVMVEDSIHARPQSGISSASIVYLAPADGGVPRYMMVFQEGTAVAPDKQNSAIGPVRSARPYYIYWASEYKAVYAHWGGDHQSRKDVIPAMVKAGSIYNLDDLSGGSCAYHRITTRVAPHNGYTSTAALISCLAKKGYPATERKQSTRPFIDQTPLDQRPAATVSKIEIHSPGSDGETVGYEYQPAGDLYLRTINGKAEVDPANGHYVYAANVVVMYQGLKYDNTIETDHNRPIVYNVGSGKAIIFQEGKEIACTWKKKTNTSLTIFTDKSGNQIPLVRGEIFIHSIPPISSYKLTIN
jgi:hypothetical protein